MDDKWLVIWADDEPSYYDNIEDFFTSRADKSCPDGNLPQNAICFVHKMKWHSYDEINDQYCEWFRKGGYGWQEADRD